MHITAARPQQCLCAESAVGNFRFLLHLVYITQQMLIHMAVESVALFVEIHSFRQHENVTAIRVNVSHVMLILKTYKLSSIQHYPKELLDFLQNQYKASVELFSIRKIF
jgi:hypothetical protein